MQLLYLLQKLHFFHKPLFLNEREKSLDELLDFTENTNPNAAPGV
jgi:hypothetical protein